MDDPYIALMNVVGERLAGKPVKVRERAPATEGLLGEIHRDPAGQLIIDLNPKIPSDGKRLDVYLHEIAHAKHHRYLRSDHYQAAPGSVKREPLDYGDRFKETEAEKTAGIWREFALSHAEPRLAEIRPFIAGLIALLSFPGREK